MNTRTKMLFGFPVMAATLALAPVDAPADTPFGPTTIADVAERVTPAVVSIITSRTQAKGHAPSDHPMFREFFRRRGTPHPRKEQGAGSGVVVSSDGYIVTNNHVIESADQIRVIFADKTEFKAKLIGTDKPSDLALIKIDAKRLSHLDFGDSDGLRLGEFVLAIGNPFGVGQTVTMGIVSAKGRANIGIVDYENFIQTDAAINPGNSGGALVNLQGKLVGINTAILSRSGGAQGIGFAVPATMVRPILEQIREHGRVRRGWLGVAIQDLTPDLASTLELEGVQGVLLSDIMEDGPADKSGLEAGDVVLKVNGKPTKSSAKLRNLIALLGPDARASLTVLRDGKRKQIRVTLDEKRDEAAPAEAAPAEDSQLSGLSVQELDREIRRKLKAPGRIEGVVITNVDPSSPAADAGLREGDIITSANRRRVRSVGDLREATEASRDDKILLRIWRRGHFTFVVIQ